MSLGYFLVWVVFRLELECKNVRSSAETAAASAKQKQGSSYFHQSTQLCPFGIRPCAATPTALVDLRKGLLHCALSLYSVCSECVGRLKYARSRPGVSLNAQPRSRIGLHSSFCSHTLISNVLASVALFLCQYNPSCCTDLLFRETEALKSQVRELEEALLRLHSSGTVASTSASLPTNGPASEKCNGSSEVELARMKMLMEKERQARLAAEESEKEVRDSFTVLSDRLRNLKVRYDAPRENNRIEDAQ